MSDGLVEELRPLIDNPNVIRNIAILAHQGHGKSTIVNSLLAGAGITPPSEASSDQTKDSKDSRPGTTTKLAGFSLPARVRGASESKDPDNQDADKFMVNLIDTPGHVDFFSEVAATVRITDGALLVIDTIEGVRPQAKAALSHALAERVKPVVFINKLDRALLDFKASKEDIYQSFSQIIDSINADMSISSDNPMGDVRVCPKKGTVAFGSGLHGWAFTIRQFAAMYAKKFNVDEDKMTKRLWGNNYFNHYTKTWTKKGTHEGQPLERSFNQFILEPIFKLHSVVMNANTTDIANITQKLNVQLSLSDLQKQGLELLKTIMHSFIPASKALLEMIKFHLPSPVAAQKYRAEVLCQGSMDSDAAIGLLSCDAKAPLLVYISKMMATSERGSFYALGRVFSGTASPGLAVQIRGPGYVHGWRLDRFRNTIQDPLVIIGTEFKSVGNVTAGNIIGLVGIDQYLLNSGVVTSSEAAPTFRSMNLPRSLIQCSIQTKNAKDLPKLVEGLQSLSKIDAGVQTTISESGEQFITGTGELHLEQCVKYLREYTAISLVVSDSTVHYRETVQQESSQTALAKSPNKHSRIYMSAEPLEDRLCLAIEKDEVHPYGDVKARSSMLAQEFGWDYDDARKIWAFGPEGTGANLLVDRTNGVQYLNEIKDGLVSGFQWATREGPIADEPMRSVRFNLMDVMLMADAIHRGSGQTIPATRRVVYASTLFADPTLLEPVCVLDVQFPSQAINTVQSILTRRRGNILSEEEHPLTRYLNITAYLPATESFGLCHELMTTAGISLPTVVSPHLSFDHWQLLAGGSPLDSTTAAGRLVMDIRKRKGIAVQIPGVEKYNDKV